MENRGLTQQQQQQQKKWQNLEKNISICMSIFSFLSRTFSLLACDSFSLIALWFFSCILFAFFSNSAHFEIQELIHTHTKRKRASLIAEYVKYHDWSIPNRFGIKIRRSIYQNLFYLTHRARTHELPFLGSKWNSNRAEPAKKHTNLSLKNRVKRQEKRKEARQNDNKIPFGTKASGERKKHSPNETKYDNTLWTKINIII